MTNYDALLSACPPYMIEHDRKCYYQDHVEAANYTDVTSFCAGMAWVGPGIVASPVDRREFYFINTLARP